MTVYDGRNFSFDVEKIAITGAHGVGKTTLIEDFQQALADGKIELPLNVFGIEAVNEQATFLTKLLNNSRLFTHGSSYELQQRVMGLQSTAEIDALERATQNQARIEYLMNRSMHVGKLILLTDRSIIDPVSYSKVLFPQKWQAGLREGITEPSVGKFARTTKAAVILPTGEIPLESGDGLRSTNLDLQERIDWQIRRDYASVGLQLTEINGDRATRVVALAREVIKIVSPEYEPYPEYLKFAEGIL